MCQPAAIFRILPPIPSSSRSLPIWLLSATGAEAASGPTAILLGDFNVAPLETDVWSHKQLLKVVSHTPVEVEAMTQGARCGAVGLISSAV